PEIALALYVGLVTDTGRFQYTNTTPKALELAAELVAAGADVHGVFRHVYETVQFAKLKLLARALERAQLFEGGRLVVSYLLKDDFGAVGAEEPYSEGIIDHLRSGEGSEMVALIREPPRNAGPASFALVAALRRRTRARTGHAGTLYPFATGLLMLLSGAATRLAPCFIGLDKRYVTDVDLESTTSTGDPEGDVVERHAAPTRAGLEEALARL